MTLDPIIDRTALRKQLLRNGYAPLPNVDKVCRILNWPRVKIDEAFIDSYRRSERHTSTGLRIEHGLVAIDGDIPIAKLAAPALVLVGCGLVRIGRPPKWMVLARCEDSEYPVLRSRLWTDGEKTARIEIFTGGSRQIGAFGWHTEGELKYTWPGKSPLDVPLAKLPVMRQSRLARLCDDFNALAESHGLVEVASHRNAPHGGRVFDITDESRFNDNQGRQGINLAQLEQNYLAARHAGRDYRVSSSFTGDGVGVNTSKCWVFWHPGADCIAVYDHEFNITHLPERAAHIGDAITEDVAAAIAAATITQGTPT